MTGALSLWHYRCVKKLVLIIALAVLAFGYVREQGISLPSVLPSVGSVAVFEDALANKQSNIQVEGSGSVIKILRDDLEGSRHQKFIIELSSGQTLLISHNIDLAPRIDSLSKGDSIEFFGEYEWNDRGGVVHWTHHDPGGRHVAGWIRHEGTIYQ
jgi:hypothetical protein